MDQNEKVILILGIVIIVLIILNIAKFFKKNKGVFKEIERTKKNYEAVVVAKRNYTENDRNLFYVTFSYLDLEEEFLVNKFIYNEVSIGQKGILTLKHNYFNDFK